MQALAIAPGLAVKDGILVARLHLGLGGHVGPPAFDGGDGGAAGVLQQGRAHRLDHAVDTAKALAVAVLLGRRHPPRDFPVATSSSARGAGSWGIHQGGGTDQRTPIERDWVGRKGPSIVGVVCVIVVCGCRVCVRWRWRVVVATVRLCFMRLK